MSTPRNRLAGVLIAVALLTAACNGSPGDPAPADDEQSPTPAPTTEAGPEPVDAYGVSAGHPVAVGMEVLADGGSAVDAAVASAFAISVLEPFASGVGGGDSALVQPLEGPVQAYDYREVVAQDGRIPPSGTGVPGFVAGLERLHTEHGELPWEDLVEPSVTLAPTASRPPRSSPTSSSRPRSGSIRRPCAPSSPTVRRCRPVTGWSSPGSPTPCGPSAPTAGPRSTTMPLTAC